MCSQLALCCRKITHKHENDSKASRSLPSMLASAFTLPWPLDLLTLPASTLHLPYSPYPTCLTAHLALPQSLSHPPYRASHPNPCLALLTRSGQGAAGATGPGRQRKAGSKGAWHGWGRQGGCTHATWLALAPPGMCLHPCCLACDCAALAAPYCQSAAARDAP